MSFPDKSRVLAAYQAALEALEKHSPVQVLVRDGMRQLQQNAVDFEQYVSPDSPFLKEFWETVKTREVSEDACFALLECMATFFREKALCRALDELAATEKSLLAYFERSGHWRPTDVTLVSQWYWQELPWRHESFAEKAGIQSVSTGCTTGSVSEG